MTLHSLLLLLLLFSVAPALFFPLSASASSAADAHPLPTQPARILFSTHSPNPWSRRSRRWSLHQEKGSRVFTMAGSNLNGTRSTDPVNSDDLSDGDGHAGVCPFPITLTFTDSVRHFLHECQGSNNWVARTAAIIAWLLILFYLLGTTASDYFSCTLEKLSDALKLSPAVAGVTLLAIGNGAPDVFSSLAAFVSSDSAGSIGFSCVLGGALFITTVVSGTVALVTAGVCKKSESGKINFVCFVRDALFLLASAGILTVILLDGKVHLWEAISFLSVYVIYAALVVVTEMLENHHGGASSVLDPLLPKATVESSLPQWISFSPKSQHHHHNHLHSQALEAELEYFLEGKKNYSVVAISKRYALLFYKYGIEWPLSLPRCLTIPVVEEERWSRPLAITSCTLAPLFVGSVWILQGDDSTESMYMTLGISGGLGIVLGILAFRNTENAKPPCRFLWLWLAGGFFMSIVWFYLVADQVVASLETLGAIFSIDPAILGLTVLAWGNSVGDLVADLSLACGGRDGVQIAISGCYAGPLFNMLVGLGLSLVIACWKSNPEPLFIADDDGSLFFIVGFLAAGLVWALVMIPLNGMRLSRSFGASLLLLYCVFLVTGMCYAMGWISE